MKTISKTALILFFIACIVSAGTVEKFGAIEVKISGIKSNQGQIMAAVEGLKTAPNKMIGKAVQSDTTGVTIVFDKIPLGTYTLYVFHDENGNHNLDMDERGIPKEGYGAVKPEEYETRVTITEKPQTKSLTIFYLK